MPLSVFFLVDTTNIIVFGFSENLFLKENGFPFLHSGLIGPLDVSNKIKDHMFENIKKISKEFDLVGLNGIDFILKDEEIFILEVNPRPTSAMQIYEKVYGHSLLNMHCEVFNRTKIPNFQKEVSYFKSNFFDHNIYGVRTVYSHKKFYSTLEFIQKLRLFSFCRDIPNLKKINLGDPVCSIMIESSNMKKVKFLLSEANMRVMSLIESYAKEF